MAPPLDRRRRLIRRFADAKEHSLFRRISSLFRRKISLFDRVGNSIKKGNQYRPLGRRIRANKTQNRENSLYFPWISGNSSAENGSLVTAPTGGRFLAVIGFSDQLRRADAGGERIEVRRALRRDGAHGEEGDQAGRGVRADDQKP